MPATGFLKEKKKKHEHAKTHVLFFEYSCTILETETYYGISNVPLMWTNGFVLSHSCK
jgi:hypothetical protein